MEATVPAGNSEKNTNQVVEEMSLYQDLGNATGHQQNHSGIMSDKVLLFTD